jgi:phage recombination protein Bet
MTNATAQLPAVQQQPQQMIVTRKQPPAEWDGLGFDRNQWAVCCQQFFPDVKDLNAVVLAAQYCKSKQIDLMSRPLHIVEIGGRTQIWPSIGLYRIIAHRTGQYVGKDPIVFGPTIPFKIAGREEQVPEWADCTVYRMVQGNKCAWTERVYFKECFRASKSGDGRWEKAWRQMMGKCAEAASLRAAFPEEIGSDPTFEEMDGATASDVGVPEKQQIKEKASAKKEARKEAAAAEEPEPIDAVVSEVEPDITSLQPAVDALEAKAEIAEENGRTEHAEELKKEAAHMQVLEDRVDISKLTVFGIRRKWKQDDIKEFIKEAFDMEWTEAAEKMTKPQFDKTMAVMTRHSFEEAIAKIKETRANANS